MTSTISHNTTAQGQIATANALLRELAAEGNGEYATQVWTELKARWAADTCTFEFVSDRIQTMIDQKRASRQIANAFGDVPKVAEGRYAIGEADHTKFYRVSNRAGRYKVFAYASDQQHPVGPWTTALNILRRIAEVGEEAAALRFGQELGRCSDCYRSLTDPTSRALGKGPDCRAKGR